VEIGIIGFGRFGRFAGDLLKHDFKVSVFDRKKITPPPGIQKLPLQEVASKPILVFCVPISQIEPTCKDVRRFLFPGQLVLDTCSVKVFPTGIMQRILPRFVEIVGTHPLFGPDSASCGIRDLSIAICPVRCLRLQKIRTYLEKKGLHVIVTTPQKHDREMAKTQALYHFLARGVASLKITAGALSTPGPARLFEDFKDVQNDSLELFTDLQIRNTHTATIRKRLLESLHRIDQELAPSKRKRSK
jgi:prephenate dehydrogenase